MGLAPYIFTRSRHISFTLTLAIPICIGRIVFSIKNQYNRLFAHLVPRGTPVALIPVIVIIETVSSVIRPGTLSSTSCKHSSRTPFVNPFRVPRTSRKRVGYARSNNQTYFTFMFRISSSLYSSLCFYNS